MLDGVNGTAVTIDALEPADVGLRTQWAVVHSHPKAETWARSQIERIGYQCYLPTFAAARPPHTQQPLFPRYVFVAMRKGDPWTPVRYAPGVAALLMTNGHPQFVSNEIIEELQNTDEARCAIPTVEMMWKSGAPCTVSQGPFKNRDAVIVEIGKNHSVLAMLVFGQLQRVSVRTKWIVGRSN